MRTCTSYRRRFQPWANIRCGKGVTVTRDALRWLTAFVAFAASALLPAPGLAAERYAEGLLWRVESAGAPPSYLFGTIHIDDARVAKLPDSVATTFDKAASFTMEVTFEPANMLRVADRMIYLDGRDLPGVIGSELFEKVSAVSAELGIPGEALRMFKPWSVALLMIMPQQNSAEVLDNLLYRRAVEQKKPVRELESVDEQVATFDALPERDQVSMLRQALQSRAGMPAKIQRLVETYLRRDLATLWRLSEENDGGDADAKRIGDILVKRLFDDRHPRMVARMQPQLKAGAAFIAVGALHLYGDRGLPAMLARQGYRVTRVY